MKVPDSIIQKIQEQLPDVTIELIEPELVIDGMRVKASWIADGCTSKLRPLDRVDAEAEIVKLIVNAYHQTADLRELMND